MICCRTMISCQLSLAIVSRLQNEWRHQEAGMTYAEEAREKAKRDVREKRQKFLRQEVQQTKHTNSRQLTAKPKVRS